MQRSVDRIDLTKRYRDNFREVGNMSLDKRYRVFDHNFAHLYQVLASRQAQFTMIKYDSEMRPNEKQWTLNKLSNC